MPEVVSFLTEPDAGIEEENFRIITKYEPRAPV